MVGLIDVGLNGRQFVHFVFCVLLFCRAGVRLFIVIPADFPTDFYVPLKNKRRSFNIGTENALQFIKKTLLRLEFIVRLDLVCALLYVEQARFRRGEGGSFPSRLCFVVIEPPN